MSTLSQEYIDLLKEIIRHPSVVGAEHSFFRVLQRELEERGATVTWYEGLLVAQGKKPFSAMFSAHIDRHGLICTGPNEFQYAAFIAANRTDLLNNSVSEELMTKITERYKSTPVYAYEPWSGAYRGQGMIKHSYVCEYRNNLIFEIDGLESAVAGTPVAFKDKLRISEERLTGQLDNVLSAAALVHLFSLGFEGTVFFTAQEEAGKSWRYLLEWFRRFGGSTNRLFVVDTSPFPDVESANKQHLVLRKKDANASFNSAATKLVEKICKEQQLSYIYKDEYMEKINKELAARGEAPRSIGSTELGRIIASSNGLVDGTTIQVPTTSYHTMDESGSIASVEAFLNVLMAISKRG
ncbi:peptidase M42 [Pseudoalteromonas spongiae]|uniref:peptidase M42 n=1 Tax=Pseudoalteromonas spongiae TaxID=298657 RepID=UPI00110A8C8E|nr:peptidase M42 [Pseudoalteromonas spongiae]TMO84813.1 peptidase M42 [Pseudoalteromonas spongiae]